jgi:hypothetical protein
MESLLTPEIESSTISPYFKFEFDDGGVYYASNDLERGPRQWYRIQGDKIEMFDLEYTIVSYKEDQLELLAYLKRIKEYYKLILIRKESYDSIWKLRKPSAELHPSTRAIFKGNFHLYDYLFSNFNTPKEFADYYMLNSYNAPPIPPKTDELYTAKIIIDKIGNVFVQQLTVLPEINSRQTERLKRKIEKTSEYWIPATQNGKNKIDTLTITFARRSAASIDIKSRALDHFKKAYSSYQNGEYAAAVRYCTNAISLDNKRFQFYLLRAAANLKLNEYDKYCEDVVSGHSLNPFVQLTNTEIVDGKVLEINCRN